MSGDNERGTMLGFVRKLLFSRQRYLQKERKTIFSEFMNVDFRFFCKLQACFRTKPSIEIGLLWLQTLTVLF